MKRFTCFLFLMMLLCTLPAKAYTTPDRNIPIDISVNGSFIKTDAPAFIEYDTTFVPIRFVSDALGADSVEWEPGSATATIRYGDLTIEIIENQNYAFVNGVKTPLHRSAGIY